MALDDDECVFAGSESLSDSTDQTPAVDRILMKDPKDRTKDDVKLLSTIFANNKFFKSQKEQFEEKTINYLYRNLHLLKFKENQTVFDYGDVGELFYIIIEGEVIIKVPSPHVLEDDFFSPEGLLVFLVEYFRDIIWRQMKCGD